MMIIYPEKLYVLYPIIPRAFQYGLYEAQNLCLILKSSIPSFPCQYNLKRKDNEITRAKVGTVAGMTGGTVRII